MKSKLTFSILVFLATQSHAGLFEDCVLAGIKGVSNDAAVRAVNQACRNKQSEVQKEKSEKLGLLMEREEYAYNEENKSEGETNGYVSLIFKNKSSYKTVGFIALNVTDGDYYEYKCEYIAPRKGVYVDPTGGCPGMTYWQKDRRKTFYYKLALKPNASVKLLIRTPRTQTWTAFAETVLGRESKWSDSISPEAWSSSVKPELKDPRE